MLLFEVILLIIFSETSKPCILNIMIMLDDKHHKRRVPILKYSSIDSSRSLEQPQTQYLIDYRGKCIKVVWRACNTVNKLIFKLSECHGYARRRTVKVRFSCRGNIIYNLGGWSSARTLKQSVNVSVKQNFGPLRKCAASN